MDLLYARHFDGFVMVTSDSDFTRLAPRLREAGMMVYGIGAPEHPKLFVSACDRFIYLDLLGAESAPPAETALDDQEPPPPLPKLRPVRDGHHEHVQGRRLVAPR